MTVRLVIIGAGGHGRVIADIVRSQAAAGTSVELVGFLDADETRHGSEIGGFRVIGSDEALGDLVASGRASHFIVGLGSIRGGGEIRTALFERALEVGASAFTAAHPTAIIAADAAIGPGAAVMAGAILNTGVVIGRNAIVNTGAVIDHDCSIGDHAHVAPGCVLSGSVRVGENALVGVGATCRQGVEIGAGATVGAGAVVVGPVAAAATVAGVPARPIVQ